MLCVDHIVGRRHLGWCVALLCAALTGCATKPASSPEVLKPSSAPAAPKAPAPAPSPASKAPRDPVLPPASPVRTRAELELQAARRIAAANPERVYLSKPPDVLLAVPVLQVDLHADGRVKRIQVLRYPRQARDTVDLAIEAVHRAAPFGNVQRMPEPWVFVETFLFDGERRFKPRALN